jgi:hypothetical protein
MSRLVACMPVLNEEDYIWYVLTSLYPACDKIIVVEGSTQYIPKGRFDPSTGLSVDGTTESISEFIKGMDKEKKVIHIKAGRVFKGSGSRYEWSRAYVQDYIEPGDIHLMCDGDEFYDPARLIEAVNFMDRHKDICKMISFEHLMFWLTFHQLLTVKNFKDIQPRMWRWEKGMRFSEEHYVEDAQGNSIRNKYKTSNKINTVLVYLLKIYHVGWVRQNIKFVEKRFRGLLKCAEVSTSEHHKYLKSMSREDIMVEAILQGKMFTKDYYPDEEIVKYKGPWPESMKQHPWFHFDENDFHLSVKAGLACLQLLQ